MGELSSSTNWDTIIGVDYSAKSDFFVDRKFIFDQGQKEGKAQIEGMENAFIVSGDIEYDSGNKIPEWTFGLLYLAIISERRI